MNASLSVSKYDEDTRVYTIKAPRKWNEVRMKTALETSLFQTLSIVFERDLRSIRWLTCSRKNLNGFKIPIPAPQ